MKRLYFILLTACSCMCHGTDDLFLQKLFPVPAEFAGQGTQFGISVDVDGDWSVVGTRGAVHVFYLDQGTWVKQATLNPADGNGYLTRFGQSVSIENDVIVVGAPDWKSGPQGELNQPVFHGKAYVFERNVAGWVQTQALQADQPSAYGNFGHDVVINQNRIITSSHSFSLTGAVHSGRLFVYEYQNDAWVNMATLTTPESGIVNFGLSFAADDNALMVGAYLASQSLYRVFSYAFDGQNWLFESTIIPSSDHPVSQFGQGISIDGDLMVVGAPGDNEIVAGSGAVYVFQKSNQIWQETEKIKLATPIEDQGFGFAVELKSDQLLVSADPWPNLQNNSMPNAFYLFENTTNWILTEVFELVEDSWYQYAALGDGQIFFSSPDGDGINQRSGLVQTAQYDVGNGSWVTGQILDLDGPGNDQFGRSLSRSGNHMAVGVPGDNNQTGTVLMFVNDQGTWQQQTIITPTDQGQVKQFGYEVKLAGDDLYVGAIGGRYSSSTGAVDVPGVVYVFEYDNNSWSQTARLTASIPGHTTGNGPAEVDHFGYSIDHTDRWLVVGAPEKTGLGRMRGGVYVYEKAAGVWQFSGVIYDDDSDNRSGSFGSHVQLSGQQLMVSAPDASFSGGKLYAYLLNNHGSWVLQDTLVSDHVYRDQFGKTFGFNDDWLIVSAPGYYPSGQNNDGRGALFYYTHDTGGWVFSHVERPDLAFNEVFGVSLTLIDGRFVVTADRYENTVNTITDRVLSVYDQINGDWLQTSEFTVPDQAKQINFGNQVDWVGDGLMIGASADHEYGAFSGSVYVMEVVNPEQAINDGFTISEDAGLIMLDVLANDVEGPQGVPVIVDVLTATHGAVTLDQGQVFYEPPADYCNDTSTPDEFIYELAGGTQASVQVEVSCVDDPPVAQDDQIVLTKNLPSVVFDVMVNDTDVDGGVMQVVSTSAAAHGIVINQGSAVAYQPDMDYCNDGVDMDSFTYTLNGGSVATVAVHVTCEDVMPVAHDDHYDLLEDAAVIEFDVLSNDENIDLGPMFIESYDPAINGQLSLVENRFMYEVDADYCHDSLTEDITYTLNGGSQGRLTVYVQCVNDQPSFAASPVMIEYEPTSGGLNIQISDWVTGVDLGALNENKSQLVSDYVINVVLDSQNNLIFADLSHDGDLEIQLDEHTNPVWIDVRLVDDGGTDHGGLDTSEAVRLVLLPPDLIFNTSFEGL